MRMGHLRLLEIVRGQAVERKRPGKSEAEREWAAICLHSNGMTTSMVISTSPERRFKTPMTEPMWFVNRSVAKRVADGALVMLRTRGKPVGQMSADVGAAELREHVTASAILLGIAPLDTMQKHRVVQLMDRALSSRDGEAIEHINRAIYPRPR